ncbi:venom peptide SjAPI-like [Nylanderia fulva]|uniref:venom peptide SjAPI-like n=1 Tax=Nylanderia fulva TaxID=613905 RepID=UPI0010FB870F|nr:venom peptide SjAPI-like [Nylanderia fulva]
MMKFSVLFAFALLSGVYCSDDLDDASAGVEVGENVNYEIYADVDEDLSVECEEHEEYSECSGDRTCQKTCENLDQWETMTCARTKVCIHGCICEDGYVRDENRGVCVEENSCPRVKQ